MRGEHFDWPFFAQEHRALAAEIDAWAAGNAAVDPVMASVGRGRDVAVGGGASGMTGHGGGAEVDAACRAWVSALGAAGFLRHCVPASFGGATETIDSRTVCLLRETLAYHDGLADFSFAMQGLGSGPLALAAGVDDTQARTWLPRVARGEAIAAFALSEPDAGSDAAALTTRAVWTPGGYRLDGCKTWISNGGIADFYTLFARSGTDGAKGISAFVVPADAPGLVIAERIDVMAPHPLARLELRGVTVDEAARLGSEGEGFALAMRTLDIFRASVGAAAVGFARRALDLAVAHANTRTMFGGRLADRDLARAKVGQLATKVDAAALLVYRAAWLRDVKGERTTVEAAMAKMSATEWGQQVIDGALQLHGALGVQVGATIERLYREIRALRIYEGATEVQQLIIGKGVLGARSGRVNQ